VAELVVLDGQRVVPPVGIDVVAPEAAALVQVLVDVDDRHDRRASIPRLRTGRRYSLRITGCAGGARS
jgi:hypothetical protein